MEQFRYLGTTQINQNSIPEEMKNRLKLGNSCYHSVHNLFVFQFGIQKYIDEDIQNFNFTLFCVDMRLGLLHWRRKLGWGCTRIGCWRWYLGLTGIWYWEWRLLHNEELCDLYYSPNIIWGTKSRRWWARHVACMGDRRGAYRVFVGRPRCRLQDNVKMDLQEVGWVKWTRLFWLRTGTGGGYLRLQ